MRIECINNGWKFYRSVSDVANLQHSSSIAVNIPHTWNNLDGQDGGADYYRGTCYYEKVVDLNKVDDLEYYLEFRGVNSVAYVYVNNELVCTHKGGYSTFRCNVTKYVRKGVNTITVGVDNSPNDAIYPTTADFTFFGGIYRDVYFLEVERSRFDLDYYGSEGVMVTPIFDGKNEAKVTIESFITGAKSGQALHIAISYNSNVIEDRTISALEPKTTFTIDSPYLWDGVKSPCLYTAKVELIEGDKVLDSRHIDFGIRSYKVDKDGFYLNGKKYPLHGVSRHQDRLDKGWAISKKDHEEDMSLIKEVGANTIRLAHYQHDQYFYDLCDRTGMVVWAEIPYISVHKDEGNDNAMSQMKELVIQNYNHPSIMFWGLSNEITIGGESKGQLDFHLRLNDLVHSLDKTRLTTMAHVTMLDIDSPLLSVPDIFSYNHYFGWYIGDVNDNAKWLDNFRDKYPNTPIGISEYGAEANISLHTDSPRNGDYSEEYQAIYHENMLRIFNERPYLWSTYVWNMFDFAADARDEGGTKGRNNKGLVTYDRKTRKDSFYLYKAYWSDEPFVHICSSRYSKRVGKNTDIKVYTNMSSVSLYVGSKLFATQSGRYVYLFNDVPINLMGTTITAVSGDMRDEVKIRRVVNEEKDYKLKDSHTINNWFVKDGKKYEFKYIEGKFSIRDTLNDILATKEGYALILGMMDELSKQMDPSSNGEKFLNNSRGLLGSMSIERIALFAKDKISQDMLYHINEELNKIDKN